MADTLGSLVDKLTIVDLKLWHCQELLAGEGPGGMAPNEARQRLEAKNESLLGQRERLIRELDALFQSAIQARTPEGLMNPANKIYGQYRKDEA